MSLLYRFYLYLCATNDIALQYWLEQYKIIGYRSSCCRNMESFCSKIQFAIVALSGQQTLVELHASETNEDVRMYT